MKRLLLFIFFTLALCVEYSLHSQEFGRDDDKVYTYVGEWPEFPGGKAALSKFIQDNLVYPGDVEYTTTPKRVIIAFTIEKDGRAHDFKVIKGVKESLDKEALRVAELMPKWKPGKNNGVAVRVKHKIDVSYKLPAGAYLHKLSFDSSSVSYANYPTYKTGTYRNGMSFALLQNDIHTTLNKEPVAKEGIIKVNFTVTKEGKLENILVFQSTDPAGLLKGKVEETLRALSPEWKAGRKEGKLVDVTYTAEFSFIL